MVRLLSSQHGRHRPLFPSWGSQDGGGAEMGEDYRCNRSSEWAANLRVFRAGKNLRVCRATALRAWRGLATQYQ